MSDQAQGALYERAVTIGMMLLTYTGVFIADPEEATGLMAMDETLSKLFPADAALGVMLVTSWIAEAAGFDTEDCKTLAQAIVDGMVAG